MRRRGRLLAVGNGAKAALGVALIIGGVLIVTGLDHRLEAALVDISPAWLIGLTTRF